ncbi:MAG: hypoxanthine phosphoribosyltransferase [Phycisphaerales bacterium]|nr:hypoxanthine phosphoribosyltransferase [Phycisphaerales bacterium]
MPADQVRVLISRDQIAARIAELGHQITADVHADRRAAPQHTGQPRRLVVVPVLTGSIIFLADLIRHIPLKMTIRPVTISSYPGAATTTQGANIHGGIPTDLAGADVIIVDDILDSGKTLGLLRRMIQAQNPATLRIAVLLRKDEATGRRQEQVDVHYVGFEIGDDFVIGYGLDYDGEYRNLPDIGVMG